LSAPRSENRQGVAGFTLLEVLIALAVVAVCLTAIGSLMAATVRGTSSLDQHLGLVETARAIETGLPDRGELTVGKSITGEMRGYRWQVDALPFQAPFVDPRAAATWMPQAIRITVQSPSGQILRINTVRLGGNPNSQSSTSQNTTAQNATGQSASGLNMGK
jgi:general secretion pathway protein I